MSGLYSDKQWQNLSGWSGISLKELLDKLNGQSGEVRVYTVSSTRREGNDVHHIGSGPNLEGGLATLNTCKHSMRRGLKRDDWVGKWVVGLTARAYGKGFNGDHYLFYMTKIGAAFDSHKKLYEYLGKTSPEALKMKNAVNNRLGDIFQPKTTCQNVFNPGDYLSPHLNHSHIEGNNWHGDISLDKKGTPSPLLLGDIKNTFVWSQPAIKFKQDRGVGSVKIKLGENFFNLLEEI